MTDKTGVWMGVAFVVMTVLVILGGVDAHYRCKRLGAQETVGGRYEGWLCRWPDGHTQRLDEIK